MSAADLAHEPLLSGMRRTDLARLAKAARFTEIPEGRRIAEQAAQAERFWVVRAGTVVIDQRTPGTGTIVIDSCGPGSVVGWSWLFRPYRWRFGVVASMPVRAVEFDGRLVRTLCAVDPSLGYELTRRFAEHVVGRLETTQSRLAELSADGRVQCDIPLR